MNASPPEPAVVLLRSSTTPDPYVEAFEQAGYRATCRPVLRFDFPYADALREWLARPERYGGLILTSPRAVEALDEALCRLPGQRAAWEAKPAFVVGPRTGAAVERLGFRPAGAETGKAAGLAEEIIRRYEGEAPLLFLCGNRRRDVLPDRLSAADVSFEEQVVYETRPRTDLDFSDQSAPYWLAVFSPSGIEALQAARGLDRDAARFAAIGPTTAAALREAGFAPDVVARKPAPKALVEAVQECRSG